MRRITAFEFSALAVACLVLLAGTSARADFITNGSFENASVNPGGGFVSLPPGSTAITGWTVGGAGIDYIGGYWQASDGSRSLDLSLLGAGVVIAQSFTTVIGTEYVVTFDMAGNPDGPPSLKELRVAVAGDSADFTFDTTGHSRGSMGWDQRTWSFIATGTTTDLSFTSLTATPYGPALDNVSVIPGPGAALLGVIGLGIVGRIRRRFA